jgi:hypothetical protein
VKKISSWLAVAGLFVVSKSSAVSFNDVQFWTGTGTNRAALVVAWSAPESYGISTVAAPIADKSLVWGYRFDGTATATEMLRAILDADPRLYVVADMTWGTYVEGIGFNLDGTGVAGITDGTNTDYFNTNFVTSFSADIDVAGPLNAGDLYWGGYYGPNWETWTEAGDAGVFFNSPDRGANPYWTADDPDVPWSGKHGQWELAQLGLDSLKVTNGSWIGFSVAAGELDFFNTTVDAPFYVHKHAPIQPDAALTALVKNFAGGLQGGQWQAQFVSCTNWTYSLERSTNLLTWASVTNGALGNGGHLNLFDDAPPADRAYYRIRAEHP